MASEAAPADLVTRGEVREGVGGVDARAVFVRHGQSTGNVGVPCDDLATIPLTELGHSQAQAVADAWDQAPDLIVTSPYLRTRQTAAPTIARFPGAPIEVWPIQEFTYLQPGRWNGSSGTERRPHLVRYWSQADPAYCDGEGAESFATLLRRAETALRRLAALPSSAVAYVFSHGQFIQAVRAVVTQAHLDDAGKMRGFWREGEPPAVSNAELIAFSLEEDEGWRPVAKGALLKRSRATPVGAALLTGHGPR